MSLKKMLILLGCGFVVVIGLAVYVLVIERPPSERAAEETDLVFTYKDEKNRTIRDVATRLQIRRSAPEPKQGEKKERGKKEKEKKGEVKKKQTIVVIEKADAQNWRLRKPVDARADRSSVLGILDTIKNLRKKTVVPAGDAPEELDKFGLKEPRISATLWLGDKGDSRYEFDVGEEIKGRKSWEREVYIRVKGQKGVFVVDSDIAEKLDKEPNDFRDKRVFDRDPEQALALRVVTPKRALSLERAKKAWRLTSPVADLADASEVSRILTKARGLEVEKYISEDESKLANYGLDKPRLTCEVKAEDGTLQTLLIGKKSKEDKKHLYAKRKEEPSIFTIEDEFLEKADVELEDIRERSVADIDEDDVTQVEIAHGKAAWTVSREDRDEDWKMVKPKEAKAEGSAIDDFLRDLDKLRVARWVDDPKDKAHELLKKPETTLTILREPKGKARARKPPIKLLFSAPVKTKKEEGHYVRREAQSCLLFVSTKKPADDASSDEKDSVESAKDIAEGLAKGYLAFFDRRIFDFDDDDVVRLTIERDSIKLLCEKEGDDWKLTSPVKLDAEKSNVNAILGAMGDLKADEYVAEAPKDLKPYGLDKPHLRLTATIEEEVEEEGEKKGKPEEKKKQKAEKEAKKKKKTYTKTLLVSRKIEGDTYGMEQGGTLVFSLKSWDVASLRTEPISTTIGDFDEDDVTSLTIAHRGKPEIVIEKEKDAWKITKPKKAEADQDAVKKAIDALHDLKARRYLDYGAKNLKPYGLDPAQAVVTVKIKDEDDFVLHIGKPVPGEKDDPGSYARKPDSKQVFLMPKTKVEVIAKQLADFEKKPEPKKKKEEKEKKEGEKKPEKEKKPETPEAKKKTEPEKPKKAEAPKDKKPKEQTKPEKPKGEKPDKAKDDQKRSAK